MKIYIFTSNLVLKKATAKLRSHYIQTTTQKRLNGAGKAIATTKKTQPTKETQARK